MHVKYERVKVSTWFIIMFFIFFLLNGIIVGIFHFQNVVIPGIIYMTEAVYVFNATEMKLHKIISGASKATSKNDTHAFTANKSISDWIKKFKDKGLHPNVLFIIADDMRPEIGANIHEASPWLEPAILTPSLDRLAQKGLLFRRAYCQFAWCNPSRSSLLTSRRPDTTMVHNNTVFFRWNNPNFISLPQYFKQNGYLTLGMGKIFHTFGTPECKDNDHSWSEPVYNPKPKAIKLPNGMAWEAVTAGTRNGRPLLDEAVTRHAIKTLSKIAAQSKVSSQPQPFFLAYGLKKPHLNFEFPSEFGDKYLLENISMPMNPTASPGLPNIAWFHSSEIRGRKEYANETQTWTRDQPLQPQIVRDLRWAYYSCITYIDNLIGQVIKHLEDLQLANSTIISFIGDHGFHLGEHSIIGKNTVFEVTNNAPMLIRVPGVTDSGLVSDRLVEFVDLFPTLVELAGFPSVPTCPAGSESRKVSLCTEGTSLVPLLEGPQTTAWKDRVFFQYPHYLGYGQHFAMGYSMRTRQYRYTEWVEYDYAQQAPANWSQLWASELYDHFQDPHEMHNLADDPKQANIKQELSKMLKQGWFGARIS